MSEFLKRWSSRKSEARKHQALQPREEAIPEAVAAPIESSGEGKIPDTAHDSPVVSTDKGSDELLAVEGTESGEPLLKTAQPGKAKLPDKEALRAMFRTHKPDGLDDYTQDFSQPELLPANHSQTHTDVRDILVSRDGQNVPAKDGGMEPSGS